MLSLSIIFKSIFIGFFTGFIASIPLGPSGLESINRSISHGFKEGYKVSLGAVSADIFYIIVINLGLLKILSHNQRFEGLFWIVSGFVLILFNKISKKTVSSNSNTRKLCTHHASNSFFTGFFITLLNPTTPSLWIAISGTVLSVWRLHGRLYYSFALCSMILGSISWFFILNFLAIKGVKMLKSDFSAKTSQILNYLLFILGIFFIILGLFKFIFRGGFI
ncbi:LysE family transporter [Clostridium uliginosum]|uniref:Threonine/homoserine/homoserine lactone efflux protein n=1 Tax=Clostridium uliginosum TaxID=119641 RepID=A0A1I1QAY3_9CLOT|nr:LysE family transporter [Clostridium uliginosum]SFD19241.1 Threonine/homoserine/homoserine lactone efflux protein [Clostridium uliginosum]